MPRTPKYSHHKATDQARVWINGKDHYLGPYGSPESRDAYDKLIADWKTQNDQNAEHSTTVGQLCLAFLEHADQFYRNEIGEPTGESDNYRKSLRLLIKMFRGVPCSQFGPLKLQKLQAEFSKVHVRSQVNKSISRVKAVFRWGVSRETVPAEVVLALDCVKGLRKGRCQPQFAQEGWGKSYLMMEPAPESSFNEVVTLFSPQNSQPVR